MKTEYSEQTGDKDYFYTIHGFSDLDKEIREGLDGLPLLAARMVASSSKYTLLREIQEKFADLYSHKMAYPGSGEFYVAFNLKNLKQAAGILRFMRNKGIARKGSAVVDGGSNCVEWLFDGWRVFAYFNAPCGVCKFEQVGTKTVPVMKLVCSDGGPADEMEAERISLESPGEVDEEALPF